MAEILILCNIITCICTTCDPEINKNYKSLYIN